MVIFHSYVKLPEGTYQIHGAAIYGNLVCHGSHQGKPQSFFSIFLTAPWIRHGLYLSTTNNESTLLTTQHDPTGGIIVDKKLVYWMTKVFCL